MTDTQTAPRTAQSLVEKYAADKGLNGKGVYDALAQTIFPKPQDATLERVNALLIVAEQYGLSPWTREIFAFPAKGKGIVPIVSVDGWMKLVNGHPDCRGVQIEVHYEDDGKTPISATCRMKRAGWDDPVEITEFVHENHRNTDPWNNQPIRMIRHRAYIQCARLTFGFSGIYDADEGARFAADSTPEHREIEIVAKPNPDTDPLEAELAPDGPEPANPEHVEQLAGKMEKRLGVSREQIESRLGPLDQWTVDDLDAAIGWARELDAARAETAKADDGPKLASAKASAVARTRLTDLGIPNADLDEKFGAGEQWTVEAVAEAKAWADELEANREVEDATQDTAPAGGSDA